MNRLALRIFLLFAIFAIGAGELYKRRSDLIQSYHQHLKDPGIIREYLSAHSVKKLQLGAGENVVKGWLNTDIEPTKGEVYLDAMGDYPFPDASFQYVFAEHLIEHLPWEGGLKMLKESHRVLAPGGKIRIVTPNLKKLIGLVNNGIESESREGIEASQRLFGWPDTPVMAVYVFNRVVRDWGHQFIYDPESLRKTLELAGFREIKELSIGDDTDPSFRGRGIKKPIGESGSFA